MDPLYQVLMNQITIMEALSQLLPSANEVQPKIEANIGLSYSAASNAAAKSFLPPREVARA